MFSVLPCRIFAQSQLREVALIDEDGFALYGERDDTPFVDSLK
jgi:hypothetical protein